MIYQYGQNIVELTFQSNLSRIIVYLLIKKLGDIFYFFINLILI